MELFYTKYSYIMSSKAFTSLNNNFMENIKSALLWLEKDKYVFVVTHKLPVVLAEVNTYVKIINIYRKFL